MKVGGRSGTFIVTVGLLVATRAARAGNDEGVLMGNQAALMGGAVTATVSEGSAIWYNPAGLAAVDTQSLDMSASLYGLRLYSAPGLLRDSAGNSADVSITEIISIPSAITYVRPISRDLRAGFGLFVPRANDLILRGDLSSPVAGRWLLATAHFERLTYGGLSLGWAAASNVRIGASLLTFLDFEQDELQFAGGTSPPMASGSNPEFVSGSSLSTRTTVGGMLSLGAQWDPSPDWKLGLTLRSPALNYFSSTTGNDVTTGASDDGTGLQTVFAPQATSSTRSEFALTLPVQVRAGVAARLGATWVSLDGDVSPPLEQSAGTDRATNFNVRLGAMQPIVGQLSLGAGAFTDRSAERSSSGGTPVHFYGGSLGARWGTLYDVTSAEGASTFDFTTTLAFRYAYGHGDIPGLRVAPVSSAGGAVALAETSLSVHEITVHLGSGFYF